MILRLACYARDAASAKRQTARLRRLEHEFARLALLEAGHDLAREQLHAVGRVRRGKMSALTHQQQVAHAADASGAGENTRMDEADR